MLGRPGARKDSLTTHTEDNRDPSMSTADTKCASAANPRVWIITHPACEPPSWPRGLHQRLSKAVVNLCLNWYWPKFLTLRGTRKKKRMFSFSFLERGPVWLRAFFSHSWYPSPGFLAAPSPQHRQATPLPSSTSLIHSPSSCLVLFPLWHQLHTAI